MMIFLQVCFSRTMSPGVLSQAGLGVTKSPYLWVSFHRATVLEQSDLLLELLILGQGSLLLTLVVQQHSVVQVYQRVTPAADRQLLWLTACQQWSFT